MSGGKGHSPFKRPLVDLAAILRRREVAKLGAPWSIFKDQVEGRPGPMSCVFRDGELQYCSDDIPEGAGPDLKLLADVLRSKIELPGDIRQWLADLVDPGAGTTLQFKKLSKRKGGAKRSPVIDFEFAEYVEDQTRLGVPRKNTIADAAEGYGVSRSTIEGRLATHKKARDEHDRINRENAEFEKQQARKVKKDSK